MSETQRKESESKEGVGASAILLPEPEGVILDMDGLALDTEATYCQAWRQAAAALGCPLPEKFCRSLFGHHAEEVRRLVGEFTGSRLDLDDFTRLASRIWHDQVAVQGVARMPGLEALLSFLQARSIPYALATNSEARFADICLERAGARRLFPVIVTRDQVAHGKPDPDLYLEAARRLGVPPQRCLALEDSEAGFEAAYHSGAFAVLVTPRPNLSEKVREYARVRFSSLDELLVALKLACPKN